MGPIDSRVSNDGSGSSVTVSLDGATGERIQATRGSRVAMNPEPGRRVPTAGRRDASRALRRARRFTTLSSDARDAA
ncbi:hypothetical protein predicted by Glimmer/Critica [Sorangium cellulosum So ce56]|uniref:Uncharacterized protein n=1 Tax=Sorangium cellulosum (strain So ce56) TaxID=448385 RepID=A9GTS6_SORC5|nr:hypothetical protein predicted by Glimmer/Critica [Sorangium cellulosum So ce56]